MALTVHDRARAIGMFRFIEVKLMEMSAAWTPTTPEMEAKVMFGRHIFDFAQHADALGKRTFELRQPLQHSVTPEEQFVSLLNVTASTEGTFERITALYDRLLPTLECRYREYVSSTDNVLDEPSILIIDRILVDVTRQREDAKELRAELEA